MIAMRTTVGITAYRFARVTRTSLGGIVAASSGFGRITAFIRRTGGRIAGLMTHGADVNLRIIATMAHIADPAVHKRTLRASIRISRLGTTKQRSLLGFFTSRTQRQREKQYGVKKKSKRSGFLKSKIKPITPPRRKTKMKMLITMFQICSRRSRGTSIGEDCEKNTAESLLTSIPTKHCTR